MIFKNHTLPNHIFTLILWLPWLSLQLSLRLRSTGKSGVLSSNKLITSPYPNCSNNPTDKYHVGSACSFATRNGAVSVTTLFVTYYNFLRPHMALNDCCPVPVPDLDGLKTLGG